MKNWIISEIRPEEGWERERRDSGVLGMHRERAVQQQPTTIVRHSSEPHVTESGIPWMELAGARLRDYFGARTAIGLLATAWKRRRMF